MYVDQVLKDEEAVFCKMSNIQSKNFKMFTQYIFKKTLVNYENKRYWLDSIYSLPFGHPWIAKIENGTMKIEDAVNKLTGKDNYNCKLNVYNALSEKEEQKKKEDEINESYRQKVVKEGNITITNLSYTQLEKISTEGVIKEEVVSIASSEAGRRLLEKYLTGGKIIKRDE